MSPEQARGESRTVGVATDVYALGAVLLLLLSGIPPYDPERPTLALLEAIRTHPPRRLREIKPDASRDLEAIIDRAMSPDPLQRYDGADRLADDVRRFLSGKAVLARNGQRVYNFRKRLRLHWKSIATVTVALASVVGASLYSAARNADLAQRRAVLLDQARSSLTMALLEADNAARQAGHPEWTGPMAERLSSIPWEWAEGAGGMDAHRIQVLSARFSAEWHLHALGARLQGS
jgi:eukaryotic-like serine/threonine-protein kinase